jgi:hypothetical protein
MAQAVETMMPLSAPASAEVTDTPRAVERGERIAAADFGRGVPTLERHPDDGWQMARPYKMNGSTRKAFRGLIRAICPTEPAVPDIVDRVELHVRRTMPYMPGVVAFGLVLGFHLLDWAPRFLFRHARRIRRLDVARAQEVLNKLAESRFSPLRTLLYAVRGLILSTYFDQREAHDAIGYNPIPYIRSRMRMRDRVVGGGDFEPSDTIPTYRGLEP